MITTTLIQWVLLVSFALFYFNSACSSAVTTTVKPTVHSDIVRENEKDKAKRKLQENGKDFWEGDMKIFRPTIKPVPGRMHGAVPIARWPTAVVPYALDGGLSARAKDAIRAAIQHIQARTCVRLVPRTHESAYLNFVSGRGIQIQAQLCGRVLVPKVKVVPHLVRCWSYVGYTGIAQTISLGPGCEWMGIAAHEILHALAFVHEQSRQDRDSYIKINLQNVIPGYENQFQKYPYANNLGFAYDFGSIMHYSPYAFSKNGYPTIEAKNPAVAPKIGQRKALSNIDISQINKMYDCEPHTRQPPTTTTQPPTTTTQPPTTTTQPPTTTTQPPTTTTQPPTTTTQRPTTTTQPPTTTTQPPTTTRRPKSTRKPPGRRIEVRLTGGYFPNEGRVEISRGFGAWGTICDKGWNKRNADVICRMLNYKGAVRHSACSEFDYSSGQRQLPSILSNVDCQGNEGSIEECRSSSWGDPGDCKFYQNAGVVCENDRTASLPIRLAGGRYPNEGRVEVLMNGEWGTVCNKGRWTKYEGNIVCRQLGFQFGVFAVKNNAHFGQGKVPVLMTDVRCMGYEKKLTDCRYFHHNPFSRCSHADDVSVICNTCQHGAKGELRLAWENGAEYQATRGPVEIFHGNRWGRICGDSWTIKEADVACRQMGYTRGARGAITYYNFSLHKRIVWLSGVRCTGNEKSLTDCSIRDFGENGCRISKVAGVQCINNANVNAFSELLASLLRMQAHSLQNIKMNQKRYGGGNS